MNISDSEETSIGLEMKISERKRKKQGIFIKLILLNSIQSLHHTPSQ